MENKRFSTKINFNSPSFRKYLANTSWLFSEKVFRIAIGFIITIYVIRYLGPSQFGLLSYVTSFVLLFSAIAALGLDNIVVRDMVNESESRDELLGTSFFLRIAGSATAFILIVITAFFISENSYNFLLILIIAISTIFQTFNVIDLYFQSKVLSRFSVYVKIASLVIISILKLLLVIFNYPLIYFAIVITMETIIVAAGYTLVYRLNKLSMFKWHFNKIRAIQLLRDSWPLILSGLVITIYMKIDQIMIKKMLNDSEVGFYAAAVKISEAWYFIPLAISSSIFPAIINAKKISEELYLSRLQKLYDLLAWIAIGISIPVTLFSTEIISILLGNNYAPAAPVMTIYIWAGIAVFLGVASSQFLINENLTKIAFLRSLLGMIANVILNLILIPKIGIIGSAIASLISYTIATFAIGFSTGKQFRMMLRSVFLISLIELGIKYIKKKD